jgi:isocitrate dehydrogenase kinase/phosphatase
MEAQHAAARAAQIVRAAFEEHRRQTHAITRRVQDRFERRDWLGIRRDTAERLGLHARSLSDAVEALRAELGATLDDLAFWPAFKAAYTRAILGRNDFELAQTFFNSLARRLFPDIGVDPAIHYAVEDVPLPFHGWEMASARMYAVRDVDAAVVRKVLEDAGFRIAFRDLEGDAARAAERLRAGLAEVFGSPEVQALDFLRPIFFRNKGAYVVGRARRGVRVVPLLLALVNDPEGLRVDAVLPTEDEASIVFSFARWYFHADVESPREVIGFLKSILPRKRLSELYISLGYTKHGKTEFFRDLMNQIAGSDEKFVPTRGQTGLVMAVFTLPSYEFVFKVIKDAFPPQKNTTRERVMERYREVLLRDRVGRLVDFQEFEHLTIPRERFSKELLEHLLEVAGRTVSVQGDQVVLGHCYVERRVTPLDVFLGDVSEEEAEPAVRDWGGSLRDMAAANIFPGDILLKNFGVTRHGRVVFYDYDELTTLTACNFRVMPEPRDESEELSPEPFYTVAEGDVFPAELQSFLGLRGRLREVFLEEHGELFEVEFWRGMQERNRRGEIIEFFPYGEERRLRPEGR